MAQDKPKQDKVKVEIVVNGVIDKDTGKEIENASVNLFILPDNIFVDHFQKQDSVYSIRLTAKPGWKYLVKVETEKNNIRSYVESFTSSGKNKEEANEKDKEVRYKTLFLPPLTIPDRPTTPKGSVRLNIPKVELTRTDDSPRPNELKELTVTASKVKFYHKGDTLIYNADAFVLPEGSMLDVLVARLPGVELHSDGRIFCNGRFVNELLLNGRDLFNSDKKLMLQNLASYTVKDIAVYDKLGRNSELMGANVGDSRYVMDVRLKREYAIGWLGNIEVGAALGDRYLGRLFAMWYNDKASIMLHAGANNISDQLQANMGNEVWRPQSATNKDSRFQNAGIIYTWKDAGWEINGNVKYDGSKLTDAIETRSVNFFDTGDTYSYKWDDRLSRDMSIETNHAVHRRIADRVNLSIAPKFKYMNRKSRSNLIDGSFTGEIKDMSRRLLTDIYTADGSAIDSMIYRNINESMSKGRNADFGVSASSFIVLSRPTPGGSLGSSLDVNLGFNHNDRRNNDFNRYIINRGANPVPDNLSYLYRDGSPNKYSSINANIKYNNHFSRGLNLNISYIYSHQNNDVSSMYYHLEGVDGFDAAGSVLGYLPSMREYAPTLDPELSYRSKLRVHSNRITPELSYNHSGKNNFMTSAHFGGSFEMLSRDYTYLQPALERTQSLSPVDYLFGIKGSVMLNHRQDGKWSKSLNASVELNSTVKDLYNMIEVDNNADPLNIYKGNPDLKNGMELRGHIITNFAKPNGKFNHGVNANFSVLFNQLARGFEYNRETGVRTYSTYNVNGNWNISGTYRLFASLGKGFSLNSSTMANYRNSVDLIGTDASDGALPPKHVVRILNVTERMNLSWSKKRTRLTANLKGGRTGYSSPDQNMTDRSSWTFGGGLAAELTLPYDWGLSTDMSLMGRNGFDDRRLNTSDVIWNVRITKTVFKGKVVLIADAYDLLRQYNSVNYIVNAQAKIEQIKATLPRYILFHIQYRFNKPPKKQGQNGNMRP